MDSNKESKRIKNRSPKSESNSTTISNSSMDSQKQKFVSTGLGDNKNRSTQQYMDNYVQIYTDALVQHKVDQEKHLSFQHLMSKQQKGAMWDFSKISGKHAGKHATGWCSCLKIEMVEHILFECEKPEAENLIRQFKSTKSQLYVEILRPNKKKKKLYCHSTGYSEISFGSLIAGGKK